MNLLFEIQKWPVPMVLLQNRLVLQVRCHCYQDLSSMYATVTVLLIISLEASQQIFRVYDRFKIIWGAYTYWKSKTPL